MQNECIMTTAKPEEKQTGELDLQDNSALIIKDNALINATYMLDLVEQRLILLAIAYANEARIKITPQTELTIKAKEYADLFGLTRQASYKALREAETRLFERTFTYSRITESGSIERVKRRWITGYSYVEQEGLVRIKFEGDVIPLITALEKRFTSYRINQVRKLTSIYAIRLYEILVSWKRAGKTPIFTIEDFRNQIGVLPGEYKRMHQFKERVLHSSIEQLNEWTDIKDVKYEQYKEGRAITGLSFTFRSDKPDTKDQAEGAVEDEQRYKMTAKQRSHYGDMLSKDSYFGSTFAPSGMSPQDFRNWVTDKLKEPENVKKWEKQLVKLGFKFPKKSQ